MIILNFVSIYCIFFKKKRTKKKSYCVQIGPPRPIQKFYKVKDKKDPGVNMYGKNKSSVHNGHQKVYDPSK